MRRSSPHYPYGAKVNYTYGGTIDGAVSRVTSAAMVTPADAAITSEAYEYLGLDRIVKKTSPISYLTYIQKSGDTAANTDAGDQYTGLDRFGRVIDQVWRKNFSGDAVLQRYQYGYDRVGNRLFEADLVDAALSDLYEYDDLNQLTGRQKRGQEGSVEKHDQPYRIMILWVRLIRRRSRQRA